MNEAKTVTEEDLYKMQLTDMLESAITHISNIKPSDWVEQNVIMGKPFPGPYKYSRTPYCREIINRFAQDDPMRWIAIMKGAQIGLSAGVIIPILLWMIKNDPCNAYFLVGSPDLIEKATEKLDIGIDNAGLRAYIKPQVMRRRAQKSGDTNSKKEFSGGYIHIGSANNHKDIRDVSLKMGLFDDFESVKNQSKESGSTRKMLEQRFAAYADTHKIGYVSTPELKETSNIEQAYLLGDQRKYLIPCPCCGEFIELKWAVTENDIVGGISWKVDDDNKVISESVGYTCQKCGDFFNDKNKHELLNQGYWQPTAQPSKPGYYSYHISSLYAPLGMYDWEHYVNDYLEAHPGGIRNEALYKTFVNVVLGETYEMAAESPKATSIMKNTRPYEIGVIPESLSIADGNGKIVLLTLGSDMNGVMDDARLDYEIVAHSESGATYSIKHGSIGTFIPRENTRVVKTDRAHWTYEHNKPNSVWPELNNVIRQEYRTDTGRVMKVFMPGIDVGYYPDEAHAFIDWTIRNNPENPVVGVRGNKEEKYVQQFGNLALFEVGKYRNDVYFLQVGVLKDMLAGYMQKKWHEGDGPQPPDFMNYPTPSGGLYQYENFFEHYEAEHRTIVEDKDGAKKFRWVKKTTAVQNHLFDCRIYNMALRDIIVKKVGKQVNARTPEKEFTWADYVQFMKG